MSIVVEDFTKTYGDMVAVAGLSFAVEPGEVLGLAGPNGAGKTTTLRALAGIHAPSRGRIAINGHDLAREPVAAKQSLAYVPDDPKLFENLTVWEHFRFVGRLYGSDGWEARAAELLGMFELGDKRDAPAGTLSRGMRQKVAICCGYLHQPAAILLDEPLTGLDPRGIRTMNDSIRRLAGEGAAIIISSHLLALVEDHCDTVLIMKQGRGVMHGTMAELRGRAESLEDLFLRLTEGEPEPPAALAAPALPEAH